MQTATTHIDSVRPADLTTPVAAVKAPKPTQTLSLPDLQPGERYAGICLDAEGRPTHHLVLMSERPEDDLAWQAAMDWAASVGGSLPTRQEQSLLFTNCKPHLKPEWHWSCETYEGSASYAWHCYFYNGTQSITLKSYEGGGVAVRRLTINPSVL